MKGYQKFHIESHKGLDIQSHKGLDIDSHQEFDIPSKKISFTLKAIKNLKLAAARA